MAIDDELEYAGFWVRVAAVLIDTLLVLAATLPMLWVIYGGSYFDDAETRAGPAGLADILISSVAPAVAVIAFWLYRQATPGKMVFSARVVDARTGRTLSLGQSIGRYLGYFVSAFFFGLGLLWVAFDARKQGWHDKLAGTVVVRPKKAGTDAVRFDAT